MNVLEHVSLFLSTARHIPPGQLLHRARRILRRRLWQWTGREAPTGPRWVARPWVSLYHGLADLNEEAASLPEVIKALRQAEDLTRGDFRFLNREVQFRNEIDWNHSPVSQLWRYHLHYFDYLESFCIWRRFGDEDEADRAFQRIVESWIGSNRRLTGDGWHPYTISVRFVNWLNTSQIFQGALQANPTFEERFWASLRAQLEVLLRDLEWDVRGNHLLKNLKALIWAGVCLREPESDDLLNRSLGWLEEEVLEQVLEDGGHFERSPGYHLAVLKDLLETGLFLRRNRGLAPPWLDEAVRSMAVFTVRILGPGDRVPLFKDTAWDACPEPAGLLAAAALYLGDPSLKRGSRLSLYPQTLFSREECQRYESWPINRAARASHHLAASGFIVLRRESSADHMILDVGKPCPDNLPAHAHADLLSFELTVGGQPVLVDSGVYEYASGLWRDYFRSTRAHNTVSVGGLNQSEVWSSFRVGRRAAPRGVSYGDSGQYVLVQAEHDGFRRMKPPAVHRRTFLWLREVGLWLFVDQLLGAGFRHAESCLHFHPDCRLRELKAGGWQVQVGDRVVWLSTFGIQRWETVRGQKEPFLQGWYSERFGYLAPSSCLVFSLGGSTTACFGYSVSKDVAAVHWVSEPEGVKVNVLGLDREYSLMLPDDSMPMVLQ